MSEELLPYYNRELAFIRRMGAEFAATHPKIAGRLQLGPDAVEDPHVERLIEAFAYLNARTRYKLDDDFPEITSALLDVLYPHYQNPVPSMAIVQMVLDRGQGQLTTGYTIPRESAVETEAIDGEPCRFRTTYPVTLWPIEVASANLASRPFSAPVVPWLAKSTAVIRLQLRCLAPEMKFGALAMDRLRFFLKGQAQHVFPLYELIFNNTLGIALANSATDPQPVLLDKRCVQSVGFERNQGMLPYATRSFLGYRLLTEYFAFPEKFLFFDLGGLSPRTLAAAGGTLEIFFYLDRSTQDLEQNVAADTFQLGCTPVVNLYRHLAEPIALEHTQTEYRVVPDARRPLAAEVYCIQRVTATSPDNQSVEYQPFYSIKHGRSTNERQAYWHATRRPAAHGERGGDRGTEVFLSLVDLGFTPFAPADWTLSVETTCLNRDLPHRLPFGGGQPLLRLVEGGPLSRVECLTRPTATLRPALRRGALWRLISHLSLNHLSLADYEDGADALREILKLYDFADSAQTRSIIDGILSVRSRRVVGRTGDGGGGFCRGIELALHFDEERFTGNGVFLFAAVLERFLGLYCSINSFSRLVATTNQREGEMRRWSPRAGETVLL